MKNAMTMNERWRGGRRKRGGKGSVGNLLRLRPPSFASLSSLISTDALVRNMLEDIWGIMYNRVEGRSAEQSEVREDEVKSAPKLCLRTSGASWKRR
jgi:hypothetical protein